MKYFSGTVFTYIQTKIGILCLQSKIFSNFSFFSIFKTTTIDVNGTHIINQRNMELSNFHSIEETFAADMKNGITQTMAEILQSPKTGKSNVVIDFTERTTFHGVRYIAEEGCVLRRYYYLSDAENITVTV